jgi:hypothetical protein
MYFSFFSSPLVVFAKPSAKFVRSAIKRKMSEETPSWYRTA